MSHVRKLCVTWSDRRACWRRSLCVESQRTDTTLWSLRSLTRNKPSNGCKPHTRADALCVHYYLLAVTEITVELKNHMHYLSSLCVK